MLGLNNIVFKLAKNEKVFEEELESFLYEICDGAHAYCSDGNCPIFEKNGGPLNPEKSRRGCSCFKNGRLMLEFLRR